MPLFQEEGQELVTQGFVPGTITVIACFSLFLNNNVYGRFHKASFGKPDDSEVKEGSRWHWYRVPSPLLSTDVFYEAAVNIV